MAYLLKFLDIFRWKKHYGREWGIQKIFMDFIKERMNRIMSKVYIFFADGFEDIEGLTVVDRHPDSIYQRDKRDQNLSWDRSSYRPYLWRM